MASGLSPAPGPEPPEGAGADSPVGVAPDPHVYRRTPGSRLLAAGGAILFGALLLRAFLEPPERGAVRGALICGALFTLCLVLVAGNFGDRFEVEAGGIRCRNVWRERLGWSRPRLLRWEDIEEVRSLARGRASRPLAGGAAFVVRTRSGRRIVFDSIERIDEIEALIRERAGV